ncbi:hypothetical protein HOLleu_43537 [Holothuria leucospilota]|uniref:Uncharacterized protein n=1 Tax=Holothuria leucospilota TaxID=206669 RepID=A0A9Q0YBG6_HOLLE|nr:hypothetical protein HOLleu_43537 [Holothuria leucospilota]
MKTFSLLNSYAKHIRRFHRPYENPIDRDDRQAGGDGLNINLEVQSNGELEEDEDFPDIHWQADDEVQAVHLEDLKTRAASFILKMRSNSTTTVSQVTEVVANTKEILSETLHTLKHDVQNLLMQHNIDCSTDDTTSVLEKFDCFSSLFDGLENPSQQMRYIESNLKYVKPQERALGHRYDQVIDKNTCTLRQKLVTETFQYIPVIDSLQFILNGETQNLIQAEMVNEVRSGIRSYTDGNQYKRHGLFQEHPHALRIVLYYDEIELANPIGSKRIVHKLGMFYYSIQNLPVRMNSSTKSVYLLAVCHALDIKKYGFEPFLQPFVEEMKKLESDSGYNIVLPDGILKVHGTLTSVCGDTMALHDLFGFLSPSANKFCRMCLAGRNDRGSFFEEEHFTMRSIEEHDENTELALGLRNGDSTTGVKGKSILNELRYFHVVTNYNFDIMHDMLEGVCPFEVKLILRQVILEEHLISLEDLNGRITAFSYSFTDKKNKPTVISLSTLRNLKDHSLGQKASQMWCLVRMLPLLIGDKIPLEHDHYELLLLLLR